MHRRIGIFGCSLLLVAAAYMVKKKWYSKKLPPKNNQIIRIIHDEHNKSTMAALFQPDNDHISMPTYTRFKSEYDMANKDLDIRIIIKTPGGSLSAVEAICSCIMNHQGQGKIYCYISEFCFSGGFLIAICCDKIIMSRTAVCGPCDAQISLGAFGSTYAISSIAYAIEEKRKMNQNIKEEWLALYDSCQKTSIRQKELIKKIAAKKYAEGMEQILYDEFFSGKYNHDNPIDAWTVSQILKEKVEIVDIMPVLV